MAPEDSDSLFTHGAHSVKQRVAVFRCLGKQLIVLPPFIEHLDVEALHVHAPTKILFLCGGQTTDAKVLEPDSLRDTFLKIYDQLPLDGTDVLQAEDININDLRTAKYGDFLEFEFHIAQVTEIILLFCESQGSLAELGTFSITDEISKKLLVLILNKYYAEPSFVKLGPIARLENDNPESVFTLDEKELNVREDKKDKSKDDCTKINKKIFVERITDPISTLVKKVINKSTFDHSYDGHLIKLCVGLVQEYGGLTIEELTELLDHFGVKRSTGHVTKYLFCADVAGWIGAEKRGNRNFFFAKSVPDAASFKMAEDAPNKDRTRRRLEIREYWRQKDPERFTGIQNHLGVGG